MQRARTLEDFRRREPATPLHRFTLGDQLLLCFWVLLVDGVVLGLAWLLGWSWVCEYGRLTFLPPTLVTAFSWYAYCERRSRPRRAARRATGQQSE